MSLITISGPDPLASVTAFFNFAATPVGQEVIQDLRIVNQEIITKIGELFLILHQHAVAAQPKPTAPAG
jgi:hypothetical protein